MGIESRQVTENELVCQELVELITDYLEGALSRTDHDRFEAHLAACRHCSAYLEQVRQTLTALGSLTEDSIPADQRESLLAVFRVWKAGR